MDNLVLGERSAGVLLHISSLPGDEQHGTLGEEAHRFIDFLADAGFRSWQILPIVPTHGDLSPYNGISSFAGNPNLIDCHDIVNHGWLSHLSEEHNKTDVFLWEKIYTQFCSQDDLDSQREFQAFIATEADWLEDYAQFVLIRNLFDQMPWYEWPAQYRDRDPQTISQMVADNHDRVQGIYLQQYLFYRQWNRIQRHARERNIKIIGDIPIFVAHDSVDCWCHPQMFKLDSQGQPVVVAGVPPDYFSETGQRWGNPCYDWETMRKTGFDWWQKRFAHHFKLFDLVRIDHFRGFAACWEIPAEDENAMNGVWVETPGEELFEILVETDMALPIIAEDLGVITDDVEALRDKFGFPGMKILQFAFDSDAKNPYLPHNHVCNSVVYTGTHDNDTTVGWYKELDEIVMGKLADYLSQPAKAMPWPLIQSALASVAQLTILPMQDLLSMGGAYRMNTPGTTEGNWQFRFEWQDVESELQKSLFELNQRYGRAGSE